MTPFAAIFNMCSPQPSGRRPISKKLSPKLLWEISMSVILFIELINPLPAIKSPTMTADIRQIFSGHPFPINCLVAGLTRLSMYMPPNAVNKPAVITVISPFPMINTITPPSINNNRPVAKAPVLPNPIVFSDRIQLCQRKAKAAPTSLETLW